MLLLFLKMFGEPIVVKELSALIHAHVKDYSKLAAAFEAGVQGCADKNPDKVAQAMADGLFSIQ